MLYRTLFQFDEYVYMVLIIGKFEKKMNDELFGWICCITSTIAWGVMFAPLHSYDCKDG